MRIRQSPGAAAAYSVDWVVKTATVIFLVAPAVLIVVLSFSNDTTLTFPPASWGFRQYSTLAHSGYWRSSIWTAFLVAAPSAALATLVGVPAVIALERSRMPGKALLRTLGVAPLVLPGVAYAIALYTLYAHLGLIGTYRGLIVADMMLALPFVLIVVGAGLRRIPSELELAAMSLGASRARATWGITFRLLLPSIGAAVMLAFATVLDEAVFVNFIGGGEIITLPKAIFDSFRIGVDPVITAISTLFMLVTGVLMVGVARLRAGQPERG